MIQKPMDSTEQIQRCLQNTLKKHWQFHLLFNRTFFSTPSSLKHFLFLRFILFYQKSIFCRNPFIIYQMTKSCNVWLSGELSRQSYTQLKYGASDKWKKKLHQSPSSWTSKFTGSATLAWMSQKHAHHQNLTKAHKSCSLQTLHHMKVAWPVGESPLHSNAHCLNNIGKRGPWESFKF